MNFIKILTQESPKFPGAFLIVWLPIYVSGGHSNVLQVLHRLFPFQRGVFEDKVGNVWCASNVIIKWKTYFEQSTMVKIWLVLLLCFFITYMTIFSNTPGPRWAFSKNFPTY